MTRDTRTAFGMVVAAYGVVMIVANARNGVLPGHFTSEWILFGGANDLPGDFGRNVFGGSVGLGVVIVGLGAAMWLLAGRRAALPVGGVALASALLLLVLYRDAGNLLGARPASAAVIAAAGMLLIGSVLGVATKETADHDAR